MRETEDLRKNCYPFVLKKLAKSPTLITYIFKVHQKSHYTLTEFTIHVLSTFSREVTFHSVWKSPKKSHNFHSKTNIKILFDCWFWALKFRFLNFENKRKSSKMRLFEWFSNIVTDFRSFSKEILLTWQNTFSFDLPPSSWWVLTFFSSSVQAQTSEPVIPVL